MTAPKEKRWAIRLNRAVQWQGITLSPKEAHEVSDTVLAEIGDDAVAEKTEIEGD